MLTGNNRVRSDVFDEALDEKMAPSLGGVVLGREHEIYTDPERFFQITLITEQMIDTLLNLVNVLKGESGRKILVLSALYGGGKTHTMLTIYHALRAPHAILKAASENEEVRRRVNRFVDEISGLGSRDVLVIDGYFSELAPSPISPLDAKFYKVRTLWGYIAHALGNYNILREYDEKQVVPEADKFLELFKNRSVVILMDELAFYIRSLYSAQDEKLQRYAAAIVGFMEVLAKALELSKKAVLIISLPVVEKEEKVMVEATYHVIERTLENMFRAIKRVFTYCIEPIVPRNIPALLKTRLFEEIDSKKAREVQGELSRTYEGNKEIFGEYTKIVEEIPKTYPFHPLYINTLLEILDKHEGLQKTRDLLRISRKVLREVLRDKKSYDVIMPWHIDLTRDPIRNTLLIRKYENFKLIVEEDVSERTKLFGEKHALARIVALALLARTFVYGGELIPKIEILPSEKDLALMVYEPKLFSSEKWEPKDIVDAVDWISGNLIYVVKDEKTGRLWFTTWITPIKYVEERAKKIDDLLALNKILEYSEELLGRSTKGRRRKKTEVSKPKIFNLEHSRVLKVCEPIEEDERKYILLACLDVPDDDKDRIIKFEEIMYKTKSGGMRSYANTIYITFPSSKDRIDYALEWARKLVACEEVERDEMIDKLTRSLPAKDAEIAKAILKAKLEDYKEMISQNLISNTLGIFDKIAYPHYDNERLANTVKETDLTIQMDSIIAGAEKTLSFPKVGKIKTEIDFDTLEHFLKRINIDISGGTEVKTLGAIIDFFYSNPKLPAVPKDAIIDAIRDGVKKLEIGIRSRGEIFFKRVYTQRVSGISEGENIAALNETDEILPWRIALEEQMKSLKRKEFREKGKLRIEEYLICVAGEEKTVEEVLQNIDRYDPRELKEAPIIKVTREVSVKAELAKTIEVNPGELISLEVQIKRLGPYVGDVILKPSAGSVDRAKITIEDTFTPEKIKWIIGKAPDEPGDHKYTLKITDPEGQMLDEAVVTVRVSKGKAYYEKGIPPKGSKLKELKLLSREKSLIKPLDILKRRFSGATIISEATFKVTTEVEGGRKSSVSLEVQNISIEDLIGLTQSILSKFYTPKAEISLNLCLKPLRSDFFVVPEFEEDEKKVLGECDITYLSS